ncbi:uncharacterized protein B0H18DRAFT_1043786 [Fomitopsis serialis]|uniref:uncharacterized protein n=1 Tax=Fomitopsis serialis TaxID=139415 RepID=UPI002008B5C6|nr:uncharacterized protein B0H18DRAFT_1043786 [Neoantrodia serialis]KAH9914939.1 hypothetical protein B0H18DRAFT_1043786 [Neoantrodia serialis]
MGSSIAPLVLTLAPSAVTPALSAVSPRCLARPVCRLVCPIYHLATLSRRPPTRLPSRFASSATLLARAGGTTDRPSSATVFALAADVHWTSVRAGAFVSWQHTPCRCA